MLGCLFIQSSDVGEFFVASRVAFCLTIASIATRQERARGSGGGAGLCAEGVETVGVGRSNVAKQGQEKLNHESTKDENTKLAGNGTRERTYLSP